MSIKTLKISYAVESVIQLSEDGASFLLKNYRQIRDGIMPRGGAPDGFLNAIDKITQNIEVVVTVSADAADLPEDLKKFVI